jgi:hypothetical protein
VSLRLLSVGVLLPVWRLLSRILLSIRRLLARILL